MKSVTLEPDHKSFAERLRRRVLEGPGETTPSLRQSVAARAANGPPIDARYDDLARQIGEAADQTTEAQVAGILAAAKSEKAAFELVAAAALGAGLLRWRKAIEVLEEAGDAAA
jgi:hypothetical protein